jgi:hypothetical protein
VATTGNITRHFDEKQSFECASGKIKDEIFLCMPALTDDG